MHRRRSGERSPTRAIKSGWLGLDVSKTGTQRERATCTKDGSLSASGLVDLRFSGGESTTPTNSQGVSGKALKRRLLKALCESPKNRTRNFMSFQLRLSLMDTLWETDVFE